MIKPNFTHADIQAMFDRQERLIEQAIIDKLHYCALTFIGNARSTNTYLDQSGNLRNSIGYIILKNGQIIDEDFKAVTGGDEGVRKGQEVAASIAAQYPRGYVLICVAGMHYAAYVESNGLDVITASSLILKNDLSQALKSLIKKI